MGNEISTRIVEKMKERGLTLYQLGKDTGIWSSTIQNALESENGFRGAVNLLEIAKVLNVTIEYLITGNKSNTEIGIDENEMIKKLKKENSDLKNIINEKNEIILEIKKIVTGKKK